jgi:hypothetical protein
VAIDAENALPIQAPRGADTFLVIEKWAYGAKTKDLIARRVIHILTPT